MTTGEKIKKIRKEKGLTQKQLAEKCGMFDSGIRKIENTDKSVTTTTLTKIANALEVDPRELMPDIAVEVINNHVFEGDLDSIEAMKMVEEYKLSWRMVDFLKSKEAREKIKQLVEKGLTDKQIEREFNISFKNDSEKEEEVDSLLFDLMMDLNYAGKVKLMLYGQDLAKIPEYIRNDY